MLRFWNDEVITNYPPSPEGVRMSFKARQRRPLTLPSPPGGEGFRAWLFAIVLAIGVSFSAGAQ
ncbi:MAG TPA: hypothetical protein VFE80_12720, partial [Beijerinckiaceae bacterium]|nr:hypothetical protein [Beijerinckiaceae bacterium]